MPAPHGGVAASHVLGFGGEDLKRRYLPRMASGEMPAAWALTEPETGISVLLVQYVNHKQGYAEWLI